MKRVLLSLPALWLLSLSGLCAQTCELNPTNGMCASPSAVCSPIANPDKSSASKGTCKTKPGHPAACDCLGKLDVSTGGNGTGQPVDHAWDLVASKFGWDPNGFFRMPNWKWASPQANPLNLEDVCDFCPCKKGAWGFDAPDNQESLWLASPTCTHGSSIVTPPLHENSNHTCAGAEAMAFGKYASGIGYHMNWEPVEYEGHLNWEGHSTWTFVKSGDNAGDNEYNFNILRPELFLVTRNRQGSGIHLEFNSTETIDHFDNTGTWWDHPLHHDWVDPNLDKDDEIRSLLGTPWAVVLGMLGLDLAHTDHHAELHPVYAMFIRDPPGANPVPAHEVRWVFFIRNWGVEGACGPDQEKFFVDHIDVQLFPDHQLGSGPFNVQSFRKDGDRNECPQEWFVDPNGVFRFPMADPDMKCGFVGEITMVRSPFNVGPGSVVSLPTVIEEEQQVSPQTARIKKLSPSDLQELNRRIADLMKPSGNQPVRKKIPLKRLSSPFPPAAHHKITVKAAPDPAARQLEERRRQLVEEFLKAHGIQ